MLIFALLVAGLRSFARKAAASHQTMSNLFKALSPSNGAIPDVICIQETKINKIDLVDEITGCLSENEGINARYYATITRGFIQIMMHSFLFLKRLDTLVWRRM